MMTTSPTLPERLCRLMQLGGEAAAQDADADAYETLDVVATAWGNAEEPGLVGEIVRWHLAGRPDAEEAGKLMRMRLWNHCQALEAETGIPATLVDATPYVDARLRELEEGHDDAC